ncbi:cell division protein : ATP-dependent zinc metalloprotease FtsH OS=Isosphaera pallida (strain ATCC 43644 / DSM 9630 / IS1B) GN=ftsH PE=3 SV=1: FtsH_ext: AAA: Peptidase_M41 [Gemmata massiliana]|uniref:ATP-dependent zinc metalloprotease FtsH n=1 Tax=Gemmata massiliana TaxID=1210884 RepID=A0A6P2D350_9BACT|nr:ATP-dependent zinc metalloprotease FtsH [Gemmata massiliana]VTR93830.1 cell division protein : ATP-dependent zinc metalloprotease FtsH OS=Isosphaera pallida (strain ATCC 43644 / DSM 9630 / IS1B) GN=ftsH PE=3 SV=1: FtsH_ext: AAA: Peptidase_M41 [Gemmata massiliana]
MAEQQDSPPPNGSQQPAPKRTNPLLPGGWIALIVLGVIAFAFLAFKNNYREIDYSRFRELMNAGQLKSVTLVGTDRAEGEVRDPNSELAKKLELGKTGRFAVLLPHSNDQRTLTADIEKADQDVIKKAPAESQLTPVVINRREEPTPWLGPLLLQLLIVCGIITVFVVFFLPKLRDPMGGGFINNYIRSPAKRYEKGKGRVTFDDVAGMGSAKRELTEMVGELKNPGKFTRIGAAVPKGALLVGPPGTGKTLLAKAVAGEANVPFFAISGSEFIQMFVGVGASRVRDMFRTAKEHSPCVIFIDEIDAVGRMRGAGYGGGSDEREQTLNQILSEMDGFQPTETVIVMAATNRPDVLDAALLRPGRFDRHITVDRPTWKGRLEILKVHTRNKPLSDLVDLERVARGMVGMSGAELKNLCNEAALLAVRSGRNKIEQVDFDRAADRVRLGSQREEPFSHDEKRRTAYHEAGHALCAFLMPSAMHALDRVSIIPRGRAGGVTLFHQDEERVDHSQSELNAMLVMTMGGRAADKLVLGEPLSGAVGDLKQATRIARVMVTQFGMSDRVGPVYHQQGEEHVFLGKEIVESRAYSEGTARLIDEEIQRILIDAEARAQDLVRTHRDKLDVIADALLMHEEIDRTEVEKLMSGVPLAELRPEAPKAVTPAPVPQPEPAPKPEAPPKPGLAFGGA